MSDMLIYRLRQSQVSSQQTVLGSTIFQEAADEIEQLRAQLAELDHQCVMMGSTLDSFESPKQALHALIDWHVAVALDPRVNGGKVLVPEAQSGEAVVFTCHGNNAPAYSCNKPGDMSGTYYASPPAAKVPELKFPTMLRKMWTGAEVQQWIDETLSAQALSDEVTTDD